MRKDYIEEVNAILDEMQRLTNDAKEERRRLDKFIKGESKSNIPLGRKFLLNRGQDFQHMMQELEFLLSDQY